jgi:hypothetical protein
MERELNREIEPIRRVKPKFDMPSTGITGNSGETGWVKIKIAFFLSLLNGDLA